MKQEQEQKRIIKVCKDERDWIDPETGMPYAGFDMCEISMITPKNMPNFEDSVVLDDMGDKLNKDIAYYFTDGRHKNIQMIAMCHKAAQIINTARLSCDTNYLTTYNGADLFQNFNDTYKCEHKFHDIINNLNSNYYICTDGMASDLRYGIIKYNSKDKTLLLLTEIEL